jgi:lipid A 3-O-deacylase
MTEPRDGGGLFVGGGGVASLAARAALGLLLLAPVAAPAADLSSPYGTIPAPVPASPPISGWEIRSGIYAHDPLSPEAGSVDFNAEILAPQLWQASDPFWNFLIPHPDLGTSISVGGKTSNIWGGAAWNYDITQRIFFSPTFGVGGNDGKTGRHVPQGWNPVGCNWWFHESATFGYRLTDNWSVMATIEHSSNAGFCAENRGLTNAGLRLGYRF